ncbi:MAG: hypothetical protein PVG66_08290 [Chromatiales bacterium]|jgi:hypothetical protein
MSDQKYDPNEPKSTLDHNQLTERAYTVEDYFLDMNAILEGRKHIADIGVPKLRYDVSGVIAILSIPIFIISVFIKDPFSWWKPWRVKGLAISAAISLVMLILSVAGGVVFGLAEDSFVIDWLLNFGAAGLFGIFVFIWPRTLILLVLLAVVIAALSFLISLIPL